VDAGDGVMVHKAFIVLVALIVLLAVAVFSVQNPGVIELDLGVARLDEVRVSVAFAIAFGAGWAFGVLCCIGVVMRLLHQRRRLRRGLRDAEAEARSLRTLPVRDAH
jgi:uncharacterized membrane protein YciS (DUF1049 family)